MHAQAQLASDHSCAKQQLQVPDNWDTSTHQTCHQATGTVDWPVAGLVQPALWTANRYCICNMQLQKLSAKESTNSGCGLIMMQNLR